MRRILSFCSIYKSADDESKENVVLRGNPEDLSQPNEEVPKIGEIFHHEIGFGDKNISFSGSCVLNFNNVTGPAVVVLPLLFQQAGWFLPTLGLILMWVLSSFSASMLCESMQRIPGNNAFQKRYEYCTLVKHYFGDMWYYIAQVGYNVGLTASNIAAMVICIQVMDSIIEWRFGETYGISYQDFEFKFLKTLPDISDSNYCEWGSTASGDCNINVISIGFLMAMLICIPFGMVNLDENMWFQYLSMLGQLTFSLEFVVQFVFNIIPGTSSYCPGNGASRTPFIGLNFSQVIGICVFAYSYVSTIPSWVNEKKPKVSVNKSIWFPSLVGLVLNIFLGILGGMAFNLTDSSGTALSGTDNILSVLDGSASSDTTCEGYSELGGTQFSVYMFGLFGYLPGIPILSIMVRYNLQNGKLMGPRTSFFVAVIIPWLVAAMFYQREMLSTFCNWFAVLFQGFINLVVPPLLYRASLAHASSIGKQKGSPHPLLDKSNSLDLLIDDLRGRMEAEKRGSKSYGEINSIAEEEDMDGVVDVSDLEGENDLVWAKPDFRTEERGMVENFRLTMSLLKLFLAKCSLKRLHSSPWMPSSNGLLTPLLPSADDLQEGQGASMDGDLPQTKQDAGIRKRALVKMEALLPNQHPGSVSEDKLSSGVGVGRLFPEEEDVIEECPVDAIPPWMNADPYLFSTVMAYFLLFMVLLGILVTTIQDLN